MNSTGLLIGAFLAIFVRSIYAQAPRPNGFDKDQLEAVNPSSVIFDERENRNCSIEFRTLDGTCTSIGQKFRHLWGSTNRPQFSYFRGQTNKNPNGMQLPSARMVSNVLCKQGRDVVDSRLLNEMTTIFGQFVDHTIVATPQNKEEPMFIDVPRGDPLFGNMTRLDFFRSERVLVREGSAQERPQNSLSSALDLATVYGPSEKRLKVLRSFRDGLLETSDGDLLPMNNARLNNAPQNRNSFFLAGDHRANEHPVLTALHIIFVREHNSLARELKEVFPMWEEDLLFETARKINIAQFQKIALKQWYPSITGRNLSKYRGFQRDTDPTISIEFSTAAFRVGHTLVGNRVNRRGSGNSRLPSFKFNEIFFKTVGAIQKSGVEEFLRGALVTRAQKIDLKVHNSLRNFLFKDVEGEDGIDLIALNLQRSRDHALHSYKDIREKFLKGKVKTFSDITKNRNVRSGLRNVYGTVNNVEAWIGLMAEDHAPRSSMGPTLLALWKTEFSRVRDGDQFYYERRGLFSAELRRKIPRVRQLFTKDDTFRAIILRNTNIGGSELGRRIFFSN